MIVQYHDGLPEMGQTGEVLQSWQAVPVVCVCQAELSQGIQV